MNEVIEELLKVEALREDPELTKLTIAELRSKERVIKATTSDPFALFGIRVAIALREIDIAIQGGHLLEIRNGKVVSQTRSGQLNVC